MFSLLITLFVCSLNIHAQGIYQLWGLTKAGGNDNVGDMFSVDAAGNNFYDRHQFRIANPGVPELSNLIEYNGKFYGTTPNGGGITDEGVIFEWDPSTNIYIKKFSFNGYNGSGPDCGLVLSDGKFYGVTNTGGGQAQGVIFEWDPATNIYTKKIDLADNPVDGYNGYTPTGTLTMNEGKYYGMTRSGGNYGKGVIFEWDPVTNIYTKKIDFNGSNGNMPFNSLTLYGGKFYGMTTLGGNYDKGVIFEWDPVTNLYTKKIDFNGSNGYKPYGNFTIKNGGFIGMTQHGGINDDGVIFEWDPLTNSYTKKYDFDNNNGYWPSGDLTLKDGKYYSTAFRGGINDGGVIFEWDPSTNLYTKMIDLNTSNGKYPQAGLALYNSKFYGIGCRGGVSDKGVIFEWELTTNTYTKKIDFNDIANGINPSGRLIPAGGKLYGMTNKGGTAGVIYEWDPARNTYTKKIDLSFANGSNPTGSLTLNDGKFYGMTKAGGVGNSGGGVIFEWDPATNTYTKKIDLIFATGRSPQGSLTLSGGKFYGMTSSGGLSDNGVIFEWDPITNIYLKKIDLNNSTGSIPYGDLTAYNGKFYGMTYKGGGSNGGVIFEWDPATNVYVKKIDLSSTNGKFPYGSLTLFDGKFYGMTSAGGVIDKGVIFEWDPATNVYTKKLDFSSTTTFEPLGTLTMSGGKFYGLTKKANGIPSGGVIFEWNPATNVYTKKSDLNDIGNIGAALPGVITDLSLVPAPVAKGIPGSCTSFPTVTIDNSNNNIWVAITDNSGDAVAEIKANGNNLGVISTSAYINNATVREDGTYRLYLDRNLTISPQFPITAGTVDIRLYIRGAEFVALKNAVNSIGQPSGINNINDVGIFKKNDACSSSVDFLINSIQSSAGAWEADYVLSANINSFSTFYFANTSQGGPLPVTQLEFNGKLHDNDGDISWKTTDEFNTKSFNLERSTDGRIYNAITNVAAVNQQGIHKYNYTDKNITSLGAPVIYYRLKQIDINDRFSYSGIIALNIKNSYMVMLYPNPVTDKANLTISINKAEQVQARIVDNAGRIVKQQQLNLQGGSTSLSIDVSNLATGIYYLELKGETMNEHKQFIKQ